MDRAWDRWWSDATRLATSFSSCNPMWFLSMGLRQVLGLPVRYVTKTWSVVLLNKKIHILISRVYCAWQIVKTPTIILNNPVHVWSYIAQFFLVWEMVQTKVVKEIKTRILCSVTLFQESCPLWDNVEKYCRAGQVTDDSMAHAHCMLDT